MLYKDKSKWNTLLESKESTAIAKILGTNEAKILRIGSDTSDVKELAHMDSIFLNAKVDNKNYELDEDLADLEVITCSLNGETFLFAINNNIVSYYIINDGNDENKLDEMLNEIEMGRIDRRIRELTLDELKEMKPGVFAYGEIENSPEGLYMTNSNIGKKLIWIAKRGEIHDWAIYVHWADKGFAHALSNGDKIFKSNARKVMQCTDEALSWYRS